MIVDITANQFEDIKEEIVITETDSKWYDTFVRTTLTEADYRLIVAQDVRRHLEAVYDYILEQIHDY